VGAGAGGAPERRDGAPGAGPPGRHAQKKTLYASEQDPLKRAAWWEAVAAHAPQDLVFVDEAGATIKMTRAHARAPRGERAVGRVPRNHGTSTTLIAALSPDGLRATATQLGGVTTASFAAYVRDVLCPTLRPGQTVVVDNLSAHKSAAVREAIEAAGCAVLYLPTYSPDYSPIELAWAHVKAALRAAGARTQQALDAAIAAALEGVTVAHARAYFRHCGYPLAQCPCTPL
jgi:transposase